MSSPGFGAQLTPGPFDLVQVRAMGDYDDEKRKRRVDSDEEDELEYSDVDDDSESGSEEIGKPARKKRSMPRGSDLLLMEAEEDDDEDDGDDMDDGDLIEGM